MKIGILTYHRSHNYGALLQAIATRIVINEMGHDAYYIDYWPDYHRRMYAMFNPKRLNIRHIKSSLGYLKDLILTYKNKSKRRNIMLDFIHTYIEPYCLPPDESFDAVIYGSDQIWRKQPELNDYNPIYFGDNQIKANKHIAYAASMDIFPSTTNDQSKLKHLVSHLDSISVREESLAHELRSLGISGVCSCLDPTLLLTSNEWNSLFPCCHAPQERYALFYDLQQNAFSKDEINSYVLKNNLKLKCIYGHALSKETDSDISVLSADGFIELIRNAEIVFTSSFHGLAFALIYRKPFWASFEKNSARAISLLKDLNLTEHLLSCKSQIPSQKVIDYDIVYEKLGKLKTKSLQYLQNELES